MTAEATGGNCVFNGQTLTICPGTSVAYPGHELFVVDRCVLERGQTTALVGPNGIGKSTFAKLLAAKSIAGFPQNFNTSFVDAVAQPTKSHLSLTPLQFLQNSVKIHLEELKSQIEGLENMLEQVKEQGETEKLVDRLGSLMNQEDELETSATTEAINILHALGFDKAGLMEYSLEELSSGWKYKCELANALLTHADLVILDEPSFLDKESLQWLFDRVRLVASHGAMVVIISHKEHILEALADRVLFLSPNKNLETYNCGYSAFKTIHEQSIQHSRKEYLKGEAVQTKANMALKQVKKKLAKSEKANAARIAAGEDRRFIKGKSVESKQRGAKALSSKVARLKREEDKLQELANASRAHGTQEIHLEGTAWPEEEQMLYTQDLCFSYDRNAKDDSFILRDVQLAVFGHDRIAIQGENGQGKSTLVKLLVGDLNPTSGKVVRAPGLSIAYFPQDTLPNLIRDSGELTAVELIQQLEDMQEVDARIHLGQFGLKGDVALRPIKVLSAGQRTRLYFAKLFLPSKSPPSLLVLDEIENLDVDTIFALLESLGSFPGAVLLISHDAVHLDKFNPRQVWRVGAKGVQQHFNDLLSEYVE